MDGVGKPGRRPAGQSGQPDVRRCPRAQAFELSIDRDAINKVVFRGKYSPACGPISPASPFWSDAAQACPKYDPAGAKALLAQAGVTTPVKVSMIIGNTPDAAPLGQAIQAQVKDGGFDLQLVPTEFAASLDQTDAGKYQMFQIGWSGRVDPDGNIANFVSSLGSQNNDGYTNSDCGLAARPGPVHRPTWPPGGDLYGQVITQLHKDVPIIYLYRQKNFTGVARTVVGVQVYGDGLLRFEHRRLRRLITDRGPVVGPHGAHRSGSALGGGASMGRYVLRRLAESVITFVLVTIVVFLGVRALPGDPARALAGEESDPPALAEIRQSFGLDQPVPVQYLRYVGNALHGDLGRSSRTGLPVADDDPPGAAGDPAAGRLRHRDRRADRRRSPASSPRSGGAARPSGRRTAWPCSACRCRASGSG